MLKTEVHYKRYGRINHSQIVHGIIQLECLDQDFSPEPVVGSDSNFEFSSSFTDLYGIRYTCRKTVIRLFTGKISMILLAFSGIKVYELLFEH